MDKYGVEIEKKKRCPKCGRDVDKETGLCPICGSEHVEKKHVEKEDDR